MKFLKKYVLATHTAIAETTRDEDINEIRKLVDNTVGLSAFNPVEFVTQIFKDVKKSISGSIS